MSLESSKKTLEQPALVALLAGILFSLVFTGLIWWAGQRLATIPHLPDRGPLWYFWKLPQPTIGGRLTAWSFYLAHQLSIWALIYYAQTRVKRYTTGLHPINLIALGANAFFIVVHFVQTHIWYDGLAQDVSITSSQGAVIALLIWILLMENSRRGLFFGYKIPIRKRITHFARKYHGYFFSWAIVYTFWYHPMETTIGHLSGFLYMFLMMLQGSLFFTRIHVNRWWTLLQELTVLMHGTLVAIMHAKNFWPMFAFGFGGLFVITQMHGLRLSRCLRAGIIALYIFLVILVYSDRGWNNLNEIIRIPLIEYLGVLFAVVLTSIAMWVVDKIQGQRSDKSL